MRSPVLAALIVFLPVGFVPQVAHASGATLINNELLEMRYADGVRKPVDVAWVRLAQQSECGNLTHRLRTDAGEEICGSFLADRMEFRPAAHANGVQQDIGKQGFEGYALPSDRTALLGYQVLSTPDGMNLSYSLVANHAPGVQWVSSKNGSVAQGHVVLYKLATETHGPSTSLSIRQIRMGQMVMDSGPLAAALGQGFEWRKSSGLNQNNVQVFNGRLVNETDLTVLVNDEARTTVSARPGDVSVFNVPLFEGNNQVTVIYRNEKGELVQTSRNVFFSQSLLPAGKTLGAAGVYRDNRLQHWAAQAQIEHGVTQQFTLQAGLRVNMNPANAMAVRNGRGELMKPERAEAAVSARSFVAGGFLSAGFQGKTAYGPGIQRIGYARNTSLVFAERADGPEKVGFSVEPFEQFNGLRVGYARSMEGPEYEITVSKSFRLNNARGTFMSVYCKVGVDAAGLDSNFCGANANLALGNAMAGLSYSRMDMNAQGRTMNDESINGFVQTRDTYALVSKGLSFIRSRHNLDHFSVEGQYDNKGNLLAGVSGLVGVDYGNNARVMGFLPNDPARPGEVLVAMDEIMPATERGFSAVQTRINGMLSTGGLNGGAMVGQSNQILVNPESVSMDSDLPSLRLKISPALPGIYKVGAKP